METGLVNMRITNRVTNYGNDILSFAIYASVAIIIVDW